MMIDTQFYSNMEKLGIMLIESGIDFRYNKQPMFNGAAQIIVYDDNGEQIGDVICNDVSYGHEDGLLEYMGKGIPEEVGDDVEGFLTAGEAYDCILRGLGKLI